MSLHPAADEILRVAESVLRSARAGEQIEAFVQDTSSSKIYAFGGEVESLKSSRTRGAGIRLIAGGRLGYAYTADLSPTALSVALDQARENSAASTEDEANALPTLQSFPSVETFDPDAENVPTKEKVRLAVELEALVLNADRKISRVRSASYGDQVGHVAISSTTGITASASFSSASCSALAVAELDNEQQTGAGFSIARSAGALDIEAAAAEAAQRALRMLGAKKIPTARLQGVFDPQAAVALLQVLGNAASAEAAIKGRSLLAGKMGERIGSDVVDIVDDGLMPEGFVSSPFDGEGVPRRTTSVVKSGVLETYLHNTWSATRMQSASTGSAMRPSFKFSPGISPSNFCLRAGSRSQAEIIGSIDRGFYIQELIGVHSGVNPISGVFSVGASGILIEDGAFGQPVREVTVASTMFELLSGIVEVGSDFRLIPGFLSTGAYGAPTMVVDEVNVAGI